MSAPMHPTMQQLADRAGVSRRLVFQALAVHRYGCTELVSQSGTECPIAKLAVHRYGCTELVKAAHGGLLAMKHCETLAKALPHDEQREFLAALPTMSPRQRHDLLAIIKGDLMHRTRTAREKGGH